ncbi:MAG: DNA repair protein RecN [Kiritimatiellae bacterium]|nr:DNA repair protein RecN [Kiritimatiellia bacterium]
MLKELRVRHLAIADDVRAGFEPGLNVITGETGAGKSILVGALGLLIGERADRSLIRSGEDHCWVEGLFELPDPRDVDAVLAELELPRCEGGQLLIRRTVRANGTGQAYVNDSPVTVQTLARIGDVLVDLHGPHDHQSLFHPGEQLAMLDAFGHVETERAAYAEVHARILELEARRAELVGDDERFAREIELLELAVRELQEADLREGEEEKIRQEHQILGNAHRILELAGRAAAALTEGEECAFNALVRAQRPLDELSRLMPVAAEWRNEAARLAEAVQELGFAVARQAGGIDADPARLDWLDRRLAVYQRVQRKYGGSVAACLETLTRSRVRLEELRSRGQRLAETDQELARLRAEREQRGEALRARRRTAAAELAEAVTGELEFLGFPGSAFAVDLFPVEPRSDGMDRVEFGFAPNVGEPMRPLRQIASSGEISRLMLALKAVLAEHDRIPVLVFDEIDANLGGEMGHAVGRELAGVAERHQVLCITHLPQVAAWGAAHRAVRKVIREGRTYTEVVALDQRGRIEELARMLGGGDSRAALAHAMELLERAQRRSARR